ncbi:MAG: hypothetical protein JNL67_05560 [Planctomycetaceae bacterium]|nr:hypothetical protein [Planctomycetaceae bacterium]
MMPEYEPEPTEMPSVDSLCEMESSIKSLALLPTTADLDKRMVELFSQAMSESKPLPAVKRGKRVELLVAVAASLLIGFGAGSWYGSSRVDTGAMSVGVRSTEEGGVDPTSKSSSGSMSKRTGDLESNSLAEATEGSNDRPQTKVVSRNTVLSRPLWLRSKEGQMYRSYIAHTKEDLLEVDPVTQKARAVQRVTPRIVISNTPGI